MTDQPLNLDAIIQVVVAAYEQHPDFGFACCSAHPAADAAAVLLAEVRRLRAELAAATATSDADTGQVEQPAADTRMYWIAVAIPAAAVDDDLADALSYAADRAETVLQEERGYDASAWHASGHNPAARSTAV